MAKISKTVDVLSKLRGRSLDELRVRGRQFLLTRAELHGISKLDRIPSDEQFRQLLSLDLPREELGEALLRHFLARNSPNFFGAFQNPETARQELHRRFAANETVVVQKSERIVTGCFDLLGLKDLDFGTPINWHLEPTAGTIAPLVHWSQIDYLDTNLTGDKKITWELNRHQYFATLGRAYWFTNDERYAEAFASQLQNWIDQNPPKLGINWASSLEVGYRAISWLWAIHFFKGSAALTPSLFVQLLKLLYLHALHLESYLSTYFSPNTHLTGEALALFYLGIVLPEFEAAERWRQTGEAILIAELDRHVLPDGVYFEQSSYYHRYTVEIYLHLFLLLEANQQQAPEELKTKLIALLDHLLYITRPDGSSPLFGDDDGGKLVMLDERPLDDFRSTLATAAVLFNRADYKHVAEEATEESFWLLGPRRLQGFDQLVAESPSHTSRDFPVGGYYVMRDGWSKSANYMLIDCGPLGGLKCGHAHADALSFEIAAHGRTLLVDPGTYTYTGSKTDRDYFRSSLAHNTVTLDGESSSVSQGPFSWQSIANAKLLEWISKPGFDFFSGTHDGYLRLSIPATHRRDVLFLKDYYWIVVDEIESSGAHEYALPYHFVDSARPELTVEEGFSVIRERPQDDAGIEIFISSPNGEWRDETSWVSRAYRQRAAVKAPTLRFRAAGATQIASIIVPRQVHDANLTVRSLAAEEGKAFEVVDGQKRDFVLLGPARVSSHQIVSDFQLVWLRFNVGSEPEEMLLLHGQRLTFEGRELGAYDKAVPFVNGLKSPKSLLEEVSTTSR